MGDSAMRNCVCDRILFAKIMKRYYRDLLIDILIIICTTIITLYVVKVSGFQVTPNILSVFIAGVFFTSAFTIAPAAIVLAHLGQSLPIPTVVIVAALGAMIGDYVLFVFIRDKFSRDVLRVLHHFHIKFFLRSFHVGFLKWLSPIIGAAIIASPLPDEFGIMLMGVSKMRTRYFLLLTFVMNMIGVMSVVGFSRLF